MYEATEASSPSDKCELASWREERSTCGRVVGQWHKRVVSQMLPLCSRIDCCPRLWDSSPGRRFPRDFWGPSSQAATPPPRPVPGGRCRWSWPGRGHTVDCTLANADPGWSDLSKESEDILVVRMYKRFQELTSVDLLVVRMYAINSGQVGFTTHLE